VTLTWLQMGWLHEISQSALAAAVAILGAVILLELRSIKSLRRALDAQLGRVFEQLDLMRFETQQPVQVDSRAPIAAAGVEPAAATATSSLLGGNAYAAAAALASTGMRPEEIAQRCGLAAGEARLLASLAAARSRREHQPAVIP
jgi:hypothetical protein